MNATQWAEQLQTEVSTVRVLQGKLVHYPGRMAAARRKVADAELELAQEKQAFRWAEADLSQKIAENKELSNDAKRKAAEAQERRDSPIFRGIEDRVMRAEGCLKQAQIDLQEVIDQWRALRANMEGSVANANLFRSIQGPFDALNTHI